MVAPVLEIDHARVDVAGVPAIDGLSFVTEAQHVVVVGAARALFEAAASLRPIQHGQIRLLGMPAGAAVRSALAAAAPLDPPLPPRWTVQAYATWSARLAGYDGPNARVMVDRAFYDVGITESARVKLAAANTTVRRLTVLAAALATGASVLLLEDPTSNLPDDEANRLARVTARAVTRQSSVIFASRMPFGSPLSLAAEEAIVVAGSGVAAQGRPAEIAGRQREFALQVQGDASAFVDAITERGARVRGSGPVLAVALGDSLKVRDLLAQAATTHTTIVAIRPVAQAFV